MNLLKPFSSSKIFRINKLNDEYPFHQDELFLKNKDPIFIVDKNGNVLAINNRMQELSRCNVKEFKTKIKNYFSNNNRKKFQYYLNKADHYGSTTFEVEQTSNHEFPKNLEITIIASNHETEEKYFFIIMKDLTELKKYENLTRKLTEFSKQNQQLSKLGSWSYDCKTNEVLWTSQTYQIFGVRESIFSPTWDKVLNLVHLEDRKKFEKALKEAIQTGNGFSLKHRIIGSGVNRIVFQQVETVVDEFNRTIRLIGTVKDVTKIDEIEESYIEFKKEFQNVTDHLPVGIYSWDIDSNKMVYCSRGVGEIFDISPDVLKANPTLIAESVHPEDWGNFQKITELLHIRHEISQTYRIKDRSGNVKWVHEQIIPFLDEHNTLIRLNGIVTDITDEKQHDEFVDFLKNHEFLTKLPNRNFFIKKLDGVINEANKKNDSFAVIYLDLDQMEQINHSLGYEIGDQLLVSAVQRLKTRLSEHTFLARIASDEFAILLESISIEAEATNIAQQILNDMEVPFYIDENEIFLTASIGLCFYPIHGKNPHDLIKKASSALKIAKNLGRNHCHIYSSEMDIESFKSFQLLRDLHKALINEKFFIEYQPKVNTKTQKIEGAEALIRWNHPDWGIVYPKDFIHLAEENGILYQMDEWVLEKVCQFQKNCIQNGIKTVPISINISPKQLLRTDFISTLMDKIHSAGIAPDHIQLEITEQSIILHKKETKNLLSQLKALGIKVSLDDFGMGYSSLSYLIDLDVSTIKMDQSLINGVGQNKAHEAIVKSVIFMAKELELECVAEGVEQKEQLIFLQQQQCDQIQGYLFSKPVIDSKFVDLLKREILTVTNVINTKNVIKNRRKYYRINFDFPLCGEMTITHFKNKAVRMGKSKVLIEDISLGGLKYISPIDLPIQPDLIIQFSIIILGNELKFTGKNVWKLEENGLFSYGFEFIISDWERDDFAHVFNQLLLQLKRNPLPPGCNFLEGSSRDYFQI